MQLAKITFLRSIRQAVTVFGKDFDGWKGIRNNFDNSNNIKGLKELNILSCCFVVIFIRDL